MATKSKAQAKAPEAVNMVTSTKSSTARTICFAEITGLGTNGMLVSRFPQEALDSLTATRKKELKNMSPREEAEYRAYISEDGMLVIPGHNLFAGMISAGQFQMAGRKKLTSAKDTYIPGFISLLTQSCPIWPQEFEVDSRRAVNANTGGSVLVNRPRWPEWAIAFVLQVKTDLFSLEDTMKLINDLGSRIGLGSYRLENRGPFGEFALTQFIKCRDIGHGDDLLEAWKSERGIVPNPRLAALAAE